MEIVNWRIVSHPLNWVILFLMVFIAGTALHLVLANLPTIAAATSSSS